MTLSRSTRQLGLSIDPENREKNDFCRTPIGTTQALLSVEKFTGAIWESACGCGSISEVLLAAGYEVVSTDLIDRGYGQGRVDFLLEWRALAPNIATNPPYDFIGHKAPWIQHALDLATGKVALLLRSACLNGEGRWQIYRRRPPARVWVFAGRPNIRRDGYDGPDRPMLDVSWFVWDPEHHGKTELDWLEFARRAAP
jgi:hypothetical protein